MARHRSMASLQERKQAVRQRLGRVLQWLALGAVVGFAVWGALTWAGSESRIARWVGLAASAFTVATACVASTTPRPSSHDRDGR